MIPSIPGYVYALKNNDVYANLFINSRSVLNVQNKQVVIEQQNRYPWEGDLTFKITRAKAAAFNMLVRIPVWTQNAAIPSDLYTFTNTLSTKPVIKVNGQPVEYTIVNGYASINRTWKKNDILEVLLPMDVRNSTANEKVKDDLGKVALQRGPLIFCAEWVDNNDKAANIVLPANTNFTASYRPNLLKGVTVLTGQAPVIRIDQNQVATVKQTITVIPYYAWANRGKGEMTVWFPQVINDIEVISSKPPGNIVPK